MTNPVRRYQKILLLRFDPELTAPEERELERLFLGLAEVPGVRGLSFGADTCGRNRGYRHGLVVEFDSEAAYEDYTPHPAHVALADFVTGRGYQSLGFNYPFGEATSWPPA